VVFVQVSLDDVGLKHSEYPKGLYINISYLENVFVIVIKLIDDLIRENSKQTFFCHDIYVPFKLYCALIFSCVLVTTWNAENK
jgi:hypothetical protein